MRALAGVSVATDSHKDGFSGSAADLEIRLRCPRCRSSIPVRDCLRCGFALRCNDGIVHCLPPDRIVHYALFIEEYERIREAEGRGSDSDDFYLGLPYRDLSGRNSEQWRIRARTFDYLLQHVLKPDLKAGARILDLGAGNCWMSFRLALAGYKPVAVDLLTNSRDGLGAGAHYRSYLPAFFPRLRAEIAHLPFQDEQFDAVIFNASFHYAEDDEAALREALRCIRTGGMLIISDTPWYSSETSGKKMLSERRANFLRCYGTSSASIRSLEYLTDERLRFLEEHFFLRWNVYSPGYGIRWAMRPILAKLRNRREPARFRIYAALKVPV
jgi:SAM-dependent methyltransferase